MPVFNRRSVGDSGFYAELGAGLTPGLLEGVLPRGFNPGKRVIVPGFGSTWLDSLRTSPQHTAKVLQNSASWVRGTGNSATQVERLRGLSKALSNKPSSMGKFVRGAGVVGAGLQVADAINHSRDFVGNNERLIGSIGEKVAAKRVAFGYLRPIPAILSGGYGISETIKSLANTAAKAGWRNTLKAYRTGEM